MKILVSFLPVGKTRHSEALRCSLQLRLCKNQTLAPCRPSELYRQTEFTVKSTGLKPAQIKTISNIVSLKAAPTSERSVSSLLRVFISDRTKQTCHLDLRRQQAPRLQRYPRVPEGLTFHLQLFLFLSEEI